MVAGAERVGGRHAVSETVGRGHVKIGHPQRSVVVVNPLGFQSSGGPAMLNPLSMAEIFFKMSSTRPWQ